MKRIWSHLPTRLLFGLGVLSGSQLPKFIGDYRQQLAGRLAQAQEDLALFQAIADRFHQGSLEALIQLHLASPVPSFHAEGEAIQQLAGRVEQLSSALHRLDASLIQQLPVLLLQGDREIAAATWSLYEPGLILTPEALVCALITGLSFSLPAFLFRLWRTRQSKLRPHNNPQESTHD
jgi:hypothetical protein